MAFAWIRAFDRAGAVDDDFAAGVRSRRDRIIDALIVAIAAGLGASDVTSSVQHGLHGPLLVIDVVIGAASCLGLWWRRRFPMALALISVPASVVSATGGPANLFLLYTVAAYRPWQYAAAVAAVNIAMLPAQLAVHAQGGSTAGYFVTGVFCFAALVAWGMFRRGRLQAQHERRRRAEVEQQLRVEQIRYAERTQIAREMHDVLAHRLSLLSLHAGALEYRADASREEMAKAASVIRATAHEALEDLRSVLSVLRDGPDGESPQPPQPTLDDMSSLLAEARQAGMTVDAEVDIADPAQVPAPLGRHAYRIVQEALTNARKHADSAPVQLYVGGCAGDKLTIDVRNRIPSANGVGRIPGASAGLLGLKERAVLAGGELEHGVDNGVFHLRAWLPWPR